LFSSNSRVGTPGIKMSLDRSPSPRDVGGWSSPGLTPLADGSGRYSLDDFPGASTNGIDIAWSAVKKKNEMVNGHSAYKSRNGGFFNRHMRSLSNSLPRFNISGDYNYTEKEKLGRGRWTSRDGTIMSRLKNLIGNFTRKLKLRYVFIIAIIFSYILFYSTRKSNTRTPT
jgi:mannan polymerase II complex MNN10 subunit